MHYRYTLINNYTGEIYTDRLHAIAAIMRDLLHYKACRTLKMFNVSPLK